MAVTIQILSAHIQRFADSLGGEEYDDLLLAIQYYQEFQEESGKALREYINSYRTQQEEILVLEAGPGTGITTLQILNTDPRVRVISVDDEPKMLEAVKKKFASHEDFKGRCDFVLADILEYLRQCPDNSFDAFVSVYTLHNFTPSFRKEVIEVIAKKLKPGGIFINGDKYARDEEGHKEDLAGELRNYENFDAEADKAEADGNIERANHLQQIKKDWIVHMWEDDNNKITVEEQNKMLNDLGFKDISWMKRFDLVSTVAAIKK